MTNDSVLRLKPGDLSPDSLYNITATAFIDADDDGKSDYQASKWSIVTTSNIVPVGIQGGNRQVLEDTSFTLRPLYVQPFGTTTQWCCYHAIDLSPCEQLSCLSTENLEVAPLTFSPGTYVFSLQLLFGENLFSSSVEVEVLASQSFMGYALIKEQLSRVAVNEDLYLSGECSNTGGAPSFYKWSASSFDFSDEAVLAFGNESNPTIAISSGFLEQGSSYVVRLTCHFGGEPEFSVYQELAFSGNAPPSGGMCELYDESGNLVADSNTISSGLLQLGERVHLVCREWFDPDSLHSIARYDTYVSNGEDSPHTIVAMSPVPSFSFRVPAATGLLVHVVDVDSGVTQVSIPVTVNMEYNSRKGTASAMEDFFNLAEEALVLSDVETTLVLLKTILTLVENSQMYSAFSDTTLTVQKVQRWE